MEKSAKEPIVVRRDLERISMVEDGGYCFGTGREITNTGDGAARTSLFDFTNLEPDIIHKHEHTEETYWLIDIGVNNPVEMWLNGKIVILLPGNSVIIPPGNWHAARPQPYCPGCGQSPARFIVVSAPAYDPKDFVPYPDRPQEWYRKPIGSTSSE